MLRKMVNHPLFNAILILALAKIEVNCNENSRVKNKIYYQVDASKGFHPCFRRANGTHQFGCQTDLGGNIGVVHLISKDNETDGLKWVTKDGPHDPYITILTPQTFTLANMKQLRDSGRVSGVLLLSAESYDGITSAPSAYSDDQSCPNRISSMYYPNDTENCPNNSPWNNGHDGMLLQNWPFPIVLLNNNNTVHFLMDECYKKFNFPQPKNWPQCAVEIDANMLQSVNSEACLRRSSYQSLSGTTKLCDKLGDLNWFMMLKEPKDTVQNYPNDSVILVTTKLDMVNLFDRFEIGSDSPTTGIVVLLAVASMLSEIDRTVPFKAGISNVMFAFLNGEAFDYIGSSNMVYRMANGTFPPSDETSTEIDNSGTKNDTDEKEDVNWPKISLDSLNMVLELGQLSLNSNTDSPLFAHVHTKFRRDDLIEALKKNAKTYGVTINQATNINRGLPPASLQSILKKKEDVPGILISNFDQQYSNNYFHGPYDNFSLLNIYDYSKGVDQKIVKDLSKAAESVATFIYGQAYQGEKKFSMSKSIVNELLNCYIVTAKCSLYNLSSTWNTPPTMGSAPDSPYPQYVGVSHSQILHSYMVGNLLAHLNGETVESTNATSQKECESIEDNIWNYYYMKNSNNDSCILCKQTDESCNATKVTCGVCKKSLAFNTVAVSPAYLIEGYEYNNNTYGAWTESVWKHFSCRIFLKADPTLEIGYLCCGIIVIVISLIAIWLITRHSENLFPTVVGSSTHVQEQVANLNNSQNGRQSEDPLPPPRTNRRVSRQVLTQAVDGDSSEPVQL